MNLRRNRITRLGKRLAIAALFALTGCNPKDAPVAAPTALPGRTLLVVAMGDSLTEGNEDDPGRGGYPARLEKLANEVKMGTQVMNLGKSGWTSEQLVKRQLPTAVEVKPQIALVWIGSNDLWRFYKAEQESEAEQRFEANIDTTLRTLNEAGVKTFIALVDDQSKRPVAFTTEVEPYTQEDRDRMSRRAVRYNEIITEKAKEYGATTVDFFNTTIFTDEETLAADGNHPNAHGYDVIAEKWFEAIRPELR
jgi:lysophospholipase L1-like esterase